MTQLKSEENTLSNVDLLKDCVIGASSVAINMPRNYPDHSFGKKITYVSLFRYDFAVTWNVGGRHAVPC